MPKWPLGGVRTKRTGGWGSSIRAAGALAAGCCWCFGAAGGFGCWVVLGAAGAFGAAGWCCGCCWCFGGFGGWCCGCCWVVSRWWGFHAHARTRTESAFYSACASCCVSGRRETRSTRIGRRFRGYLVGVSPKSIDRRSGESAQKQQTFCAILSTRPPAAPRADNCCHPDNYTG
jgi:hypothetical protein